MILSSLRGMLPLTPAPGNGERLWRDACRYAKDEAIAGGFA